MNFKDAWKEIVKATATDKAMSVSMGNSDNNKKDSWIKTFDKQNKLIQEITGLTSSQVMGMMSMILRNPQIAHVKYGNKTDSFTMKSSGNISESKHSNEYGSKYDIKEGTADVMSGMGKAVGVEYAGPVPNSKLADQDLEGETKKSSYKSGSREQAREDIKYHATHGVSIQNSIKNIVRRYGLDSWEAEEMALNIYNSLRTRKGTVEQTGKKLDALAEKAEDAETEKQKSTLIARIGRVQVQRQQAVINARKNGTGSFKEFWRNNTHG